MVLSAGYFYLYRRLMLNLTIFEILNIYFQVLDLN